MRTAPIFLSLVSATLFAQSQTATQAPAPRDIAAKARPAVVLISAMRGDDVVSRGSGFAVDASGTIITNRHVIEGAETLQVQLASGEIYDNVYYIADDQRRDLAILRIPDSGNPHLSIADEREAAVGDRVFVMGNPMGLEGTFSDGLISAVRTIDGVTMIQMTAPISSGSSGGPVLNDSGEVIGVATLTMREGQNLNMAVPARYARGLMAMNQNALPFAEAAERFASAPAAASNPMAATADEEMEPWLRVLTEEMRVLKEAALNLGYEVTHEPTMGMLAKEASHSFEQMFSDNGADVKMIGACDIDCSDLDIVVYDMEGNEIIKDVLVDDRPEVDFTITRPGSLRIVVYMAECTEEPCGFGVQTFRKK